jgi:hypothetical protein
MLFRNLRIPLAERAKKILYWYVGEKVIDHALLPGPYRRLGAPAAALPVEPMYSKRIGRLTPGRGESSPKL